MGRIYSGGRKMAVKKIRKIRKVKKSFQAKIGKKMVTIQTGCKTVTKPLFNKDSEPAGKCKTCGSKYPDVQAVCLELHRIANEKVEKKEARKPTGERKKRRTTQPYEEVVRCIASGMANKDIVQEFKDKFNSEKTAKWFVGAVKCCYNGIAGKSRKQDGIVFLYGQWLANGSKGNPPTVIKNGVETSGDKSSIHLLKTIHSIMEKMEEEFEE
jgi:hypothetical protein